MGVTNQTIFTPKGVPRSALCAPIGDGNEAMRPEFKRLRIKQLERALAPFTAAKDSPRPQRGWLRAVREATGITIRQMATRLGKAPSLAAKLEKSEAEYRITLGSLRDAAEALGCQLVYALVPKNGSIQGIAEQRARTKAAENVRAVEHSMVLEDQAVGGIEDKIEEETRRILKRGGKK
jgi:predicted DNA-binding mobile mystery protein A